MHFTSSLFAAVLVMLLCGQQMATLADSICENGSTPEAAELCKARCDTLKFRYSFCFNGDCKCAGPIVGRTD
ncbi:Potassium channel toxin alpha-KTx 18.3 [Anopheles sinensis]|uniref:Potassium channel toxin alpha-KTx 18.3 n=1 Tax=Anopheles sinensis TaxID=74873 RepID=A0A084WJA1_ANOSI|nr:Potassium channel toxin alpha-KTx 18.3 [Anopheles sinensis]